MKFKRAYETVLLSDALIVYTTKIKSKNEYERVRFKIELMKLEMIGKMITGEDLKLIEQWEKSSEGKPKKQINEKSLQDAGFIIE